VIFVSLQKTCNGGEVLAHRNLNVMYLEGKGTKKTRFEQQQSLLGL